MLKIFDITERRHDRNIMMAKIAEQYKNESFKDINKVIEILNLIQDYSDLYIFMLAYQLKHGESKKQRASLLKTVMISHTEMNNINFHYDEKQNALDMSNNTKLDENAFLFLLNRTGMRSVNLLRFLELKRLDLSHTNLKNLDKFDTLKELEELDVSHTKANKFGHLLKLKEFKKLTFSNQAKHHSAIDKLSEKGVKIIKR